MLLALAELKRDAKLQKVTFAANARNQTLDALKKVSSADLPMEDPELLQVSIQHRRWIQMQRSKLNQKLALQTAVWLEARSDAAQSVGRADVLKKISGKQRAH
jgi:hypothetical protein